MREAVRGFVTAKNQTFKNVSRHQEAESRISAAKIKEKKGRGGAKNW